MYLSPDVPEENEYDVVVCGGGCSGWVAAVAAARHGARTALIERYGFLGGTATGGLVVPISGFFKSGKRVIGGIAYEFVKKMEAAGAACFEMPKGHVSVDPEYYKLFAQRMLLASGADLYSNSVVVSAEKENGEVSSVLYSGPDGTGRIRGKFFIDATGNGNLLKCAGISMTENESLQPMSLCFELSGVDLKSPLMKDCIHHNGKNGPHFMQ